MLKVAEPEVLSAQLRSPDVYRQWFMESTWPARWKRNALLYLNKRTIVHYSRSGIFSTEHDLKPIAPTSKKSILNANGW